MLTRAQLDRIPNDHLNARNTRPLIEFLYARGWSMTLLELENERHRRQIRRRPYVTGHTNRKEA